MQSGTALLKDAERAFAGALKECGLDGVGQTADGLLGVIGRKSVYEQAELLGVLREFLEGKGETLPPLREVDLPYHLEPDHFETEDKKNEEGRDAAY